MDILDSTLREGEQQYGVFFPLDIKVELARELAEIADFVEIGSPLIAPSYAAAAEKLIEIVSADQLIFHCLLDEEHVRAAHALGAKWIGLFVAIREDLHTIRYGKAFKETAKTLTALLSLSRNLGLKVRLTCEDASRTRVRELVGFYSTAISCGVERIGFADTVGTLTPSQTRTYIEALQYAGIPIHKLHMHFHNDRGYANDNADVAAKLGVACVDGTVTGVGERVGITQTEYLTGLLGRRPSGSLRRARDLVEANTAFYPVSSRWFAHKSGIHINGVLKYPYVYERCQPENLLSQRLIVLSKLSGRSAVSHYLELVPSRHRYAKDLVLDTIKKEETLEIASSAEFNSFIEYKELLSA